MPEIKLTVFSVEETLDVGRALGERFPAGTVFLLTGELGSGKSTLAKGIAEGQGADSWVTSPAFTFVHEYGDRLVHIDLYLMAAEKFEALGIDEYFDGTRSIIVEWADRLPAAFRGTLANAVEINMSIVDFKTREIHLKYAPLSFGSRPGAGGL